MTGKGNKDCCCNGCYERPIDRALPVRAIQPMQQNCCACIPKQVCVTLACYGATEGLGGTKLFTRDCTAVEGDPTLWSGDFPFGGDIIDLEFRFKVVDGVCYFCLTSSTLGIYGETPDDCHVIDAEQRATPNFFCQRLHINEQPAEWTIANPLCASGSVVVSIGSADNTAIEGRRRCLDVYGNELEDSHPIRNLCGGCGCICECACITVFGDDLTASSEVVCLDGTTSWLTTGGVEISMVANEETGCCELELTDVGNTGMDPYSASGNVRVGGVDNQCPNPTADWSGFTPDGKARFIQFQCASCNGECPEQQGCCDELVPHILTATIDADDCTCACGDTSIKLVWDDDFNAWIGEQPEWFCGHEISMTLSCVGDGETWRLAMSAGPCIFPANVEAVGECSPLSVEFSITSSGGLGCCGLGDLGGSKNFTVTITE